MFWVLGLLAKTGQFLQFFSCIVATVLVQFSNWKTWRKLAFCLIPLAFSFRMDARLGGVLGFCVACIAAFTFMSRMEELFSD